MHAHRCPFHSLQPKEQHAMSNDKSSLMIPDTTTTETTNDGVRVMQHPGGALQMQFGRAEDSTDARFANESVRSGVSSGEGYRTDEAGNVERFGAVTRVATTPPAFSDDPL